MRTGALYQVLFLFLFCLFFSSCLLKNQEQSDLQEYERWKVFEMRREDSLRKVEERRMYGTTVKEQEVQWRRSREKVEKRQKSFSPLAFRTALADNQGPGAPHHEKIYDISKMQISDSVCDFSFISSESYCHGWLGDIKFSGDTLYLLYERVYFDSLPLASEWNQIKYTFRVRIPGKKVPKVIMPFEAHLQGEKD